MVARRRRSSSWWALGNQGSFLVVAILLCSIAVAGSPQAPGPAGLRVSRGNPGATRTASNDAVAQAAGPPIAAHCVWSRQLGPDAIVARSSPNVAMLGGGPAVVFGTEQGNAQGPGALDALDLSNGAPVAGWPVNLPRGVWSTPSVGTSTPGGAVVFVGDGTPAQGGGSYYGITAGGQVAWRYQGTDPNYGQEAVVASPAFGALGGRQAPSVVGGSVGLRMYALDAVNGMPDPGWPVLQSDTNFSSPALADIQGNGQLQVVTGDDSSPGGGGADFTWVPGDKTWAGGMVRALNAAGQTLWVFRTDEVVQSSPAIGTLDGQYDVVFGTGDYFATHGVATTDSTSLFALNAATGDLVWRANLGGYTGSSPALADLYGNGQLDVVEAASLPLGQPAPASQTEVWALDGSGKALPGWPVMVPAGGVIGSVVTADLQGNGTQDVLVPTTEGLYVYSPTGLLIGRFGTGQEPWHCPVSLPMGLQGSPLVSMDPNGTVGLTLAGYNAFGGLVVHYEITSSRAIGAQAWPQFRGNAELTGAFPAPPPACLDSAGVGSATSGYWLAGRDGGIFSFGNAGFHGSLPALGIADPFPIVGMAPTPSGQGYWLVDSAGDVYSFGNAAFHGSLAQVGVTDRSVVGIEADPSGQGYWLVDSAGSVFSFGNAGFHGSMGGVDLNAPVIGMMVDRTSSGYWLVASDGGIFSFAAPFEGSTGCLVLQEPVTSLAAVP